MSTPPRSPKELAALLDTLAANIGEVFLGKPEVIRLTMVALLADGHLLLEDVPGVGKTLLAKALARSLACKFNRIQFTPDLLPGDLIGVTIYREKSGEFSFQPGPLFAEVVLADEINRATPRTQSALLEAMSERQVTVDGITHRLGPPFLVVATQNPHEFEGTYPLPESQLDRFLIRVKIGYPEREAERAILAQHREGEPVEDLKPVLLPTDVLALQNHTRTVRVETAITDYILDLVNHTRTHPEVQLGASTRAALALYRGSQALAVSYGRDFVIPDDVKRPAAPVLALASLAVDTRRPSGRNPVVREVLAKSRCRREADRQFRGPPSGRLVLSREEELVARGHTHSVLVGWLKSINLVLILAYLMATLLFLNGLLARIQVRRVTVVRGASLPVMPGNCSVRVTATTPASGRPLSPSRIESAECDGLARSPTSRSSNHSL